MRSDNHWKRTILCGGLSLGLALSGIVARSDGVAPEVYARVAAVHFYNLDYQEAIANLQKALEGDPDNNIFYNSLTNAYLFQELFRKGQMEGNLYLASNDFLKTKKPTLDAARMELIQQRVATVKRRCEQRLREDPEDTDALYALGVAFGGNLQLGA